jgi:hypothetical protein
MCLTAASVILYNLYQVPLIHEAMAPHVGQWLGVFYYKQFSRRTWPVLAGYAAMVLLFLLVCVFFFFGYFLLVSFGFFWFLLGFFLFLLNQKLIFTFNNRLSLHIKSEL